ncbi:expressed unknown protein [Seminavis robusta]|uniref:Uncharacterized protein n=1 Tax=Seminavis robusta TaxID=568900 RepID=A0A9N8EB01_9STRA|nr:expressed unknown protein [Seminavis robusta]|eukprot:Sro881_g215260.1 n/a (240) ;mRNA; f:31818-32537
MLSLLGIATHTAAAASNIRYDLQEQGETGHGTRFQRFVAINAESGQSLTMLDWTKALQDGDVASLNAVLANAPFRAVYFELPPVTHQSVAEQPFEFVLLEAASLTKRKPRFRSFQDPCERAQISDPYGCVFPNLSGDAVLIVPKPQENGSGKHYTHLANFVRQAPPAQVDALWKLVATAYQSQWEQSANTVWLSTAGNGVPWLHFRLDRAPKYYRYNPYKTPMVCHVNDHKHDGQQEDL